jgi:hypothetical protein
MSAKARALSPRGQSNLKNRPQQLVHNTVHQNTTLFKPVTEKNPTTDLLYRNEQPIEAYSVQHLPPKMFCAVYLLMLRWTQ